MAFNPTSTICLCNVPIDNTYKNQFFFMSKEEQQTYFSGKVVKCFNDYLTVKTTLSDGSLVSSIKVDANIDDLYGCNYMYYQNANHGTRYFYAFITSLKYINEGTTEIVFETDVHQTWCFDVTLRESYVAREHSKTDKRGDNIVPESFNFQDYTFTKYVDGFTTLGEWGYLIATTEALTDEGVKLTGDDPVGTMLSGVFQGLFFYYFTGKTNALGTFLKNIDRDCVISISVIPHFNVSENKIGTGDNSTGEGRVYASSNVATRDYNIDTSVLKDFEGFTPKNNKLFTSPYFKLIVTNNNGDEGEYAIEDFDDPKNVTFKLYGDVSINPSLTLIPQDYKKVSEYYGAGVSIKNFPQSSFNTDTFKLWLTKNQFSTGASALTSVGSIAAGVALTATGAGSTIGVGMIATGAMGVVNSMNGVYQASVEPNRGHTGNTHNNLLTAMGRNKFDIYLRRIKRTYAESLDAFFTMYGYQTNRLKVPNVNSRPYFNYVQTVDVNLTGNIPDTDMRQLKAMYNGGVTFWKPTATVGDYTVDNSP